MIRHRIRGVCRRVAAAILRALRVRPSAKTRRAQDLLERKLRALGYDGQTWGPRKALGEIMAGTATVEDFREIWLTVGGLPHAWAGRLGLTPQEMSRAAAEGLLTDPAATVRALFAALDVLLERR